jgi:RNA polymerase sigma-70 factor (ECF subfamily)
MGIGRGDEDEACLLDACRRGDRDAFRRLFVRHKDRAYGTALHFFRGDAAAAEDVTQDVFVRLFTRLDQFRGGAEFSTYLHRLVVNACLDELRRRRRFVPLAETDDRCEPPDAAPEPYSRWETSEALRVALAGLPAPLRLTILLKYFDDLSYDEMARALGCSAGTVASRLHRGLKLLGARLNDLDPAGDA